MVSAPDNVLIELFQVDKTKLPQQYVDYFEWSPDNKNLNG
jgi:hypothetical protein